jgi:capsular exopolysaccharide synthesis family protein
MDRIQRALDKAKAKNNVLSTVEQQINSLNKETKSQNKASSITEIAYTKTKVINVTNAQLESKRIIAGLYHNSQSAVFRMLRTQVLKKMRDNGYQTLAISSPTAGEGKSLVASNLAVAIAMELNQTVLLVDMDLRNPSLSDYFSLNAELGLKDYLEKNVSLHQVLVNPGIKRMVILPGKGRAEDSAELLSSPKMASLVSDLKEQYDSRMIIFDVPPILQTDDVMLSSDYFDATLLVLEDGKNKEVEIKKAIQLLDGQNLIGTVLNKSEKQPTHQNY